MFCFFILQSTNKLGADVGYHTRSMSKKADGKPSDTLNILTRSTTKSTEIYASPKHKPKDNVETGSEKKRPSTPRSCKKSVSFIYLFLKCCVVVGLESFGVAFKC